MHASVHLVPTLFLLLAGCPPTEDDTDGGALQWYTTCGDPSCHGYDAAAHTSAVCTDEVVGETCTPEGAGCDLEDDCNVELICATEDPKDQVGGCPISLRAAKTGIHYLEPADGQALHDALLGVRLARYRYRVEPGDAADHLGFIIDDQPAGSPAVLPNGQRVDLYGYTSMAVAALQVQEAQIRAQQAQIDAQQVQLEALQSRLEALEGQGAAGR